MQATNHNVFAVVLAAGSASRFGTTKQLACIGDATLVERSLRTAEAACGSRTVLVAGHEWQAVAAACKPLAGFLCLNDDHQAGMGGSIACGMRAVANAADAVLLMLADQPLVSVDHLQNLTDAWSSADDSIVASGYAGTHGPPVVFPRRDFAALSELDGDEGARRIIEENSDRLLSVAFEDAAKDVDRPEDLTGVH